MYKENALYEMLDDCTYIGTSKDRIKLSSLEEKEHFIIPFTYINLTHMALNVFSVASMLSSAGHQVSILLHDNNVLSYKTSTRAVFPSSVLSVERYSEYLVEEITGLLKILGANMSNISIIKSSDTWYYLAKNKFDLLNFYYQLGNISLSPKSTDKALYSTFYHVIQRPLDMYAINNFSKIFGSKFKDPKFVIVLGNRAESYIKIGEAMQNRYSYYKGLKIPVVLRLKDIPMFMYDKKMPSQQMNYEELYSVIKALRIDERDKAKFVNNFILPFEKFLKYQNIIRSDLGLKTKKLTDRTIADYFYAMYRIFDRLLEKVDLSENREEISIKTSEYFNQIRSIITHKAILKILPLCDGANKVSDIAKKSNMNIANVSAYINKMRAAGIVTTDQKPKIRFSSIVINSDVFS
ncbi:MAG: helix-turn-helix domain-containing protein [Candidatus Micrarchaeales archaeon]|jgi:DNA-binding MarR family transcriptional regulator|uniref:HTH arsR-type domain-containing protein n=1 Tax=Candidatus Micrarchaeum acidiphilum ARMAN-2 TaxID=425595 RepID=C7DHB8_MICA2|nr:MAG: hypothetical protein UNLARM2_0464 [Candidatus Micrarchaeum acidiphilum ARMAN-2]MCW6160587.1 helix-turn-helix domain-containing protein [Candidatus Micrarchaeales archaeon]